MVRETSSRGVYLRGGVCSFLADTIRTTEIANNGYRDGFSNLNNTEESFRNDGPSISVDQRKMNAVRAYFEWMPIRQVDLDDNLRVWRSFQLGKLMDLIIVDTRNYDRSITSLGKLPPPPPFLSFDSHHKSTTC